jgi:hypothetical protein
MKILLLALMLTSCTVSVSESILRQHPNTMCIDGTVYKYDPHTYDMEALTIDVDCKETFGG